MTDLGGEPACWAHLADELDSREQPSRTVHVDLSHVAEQGTGAVWSLPHDGDLDGDLDANLVRLDGGEAIGRHVNHEVDVLVVVWRGAGEMTVDDHPLPLHPGVVALVPRDAARAMRAGQDGVSYFTVHRRRGSLTVGRR